MFRSVAAFSKNNWRQQLPFEQVVASPKGVADLYRRNTFICEAQYTLKVFQDFVPSDGAQSPYVPSGMAKRVEGLVRVPNGIELDSALPYSPAPGERSAAGLLRSAR